MAYQRLALSGGRLHRKSSVRARNAITARVLYLGPKEADTVLETNAINANAIRAALTDLKANRLWQANNAACKSQACKLVS